MRRTLTLAGLALALLPATRSSAQVGTYCNGALSADDFGRHYYPNGQIIADEFGANYYPNGRAIKDLFGRIYYPNGQVVRDDWGQVHYPNGQLVRDDFGVYFPNGQVVRDDFGCYWPTGAAREPCLGWVPLEVTVPGYGQMSAALGVQSGQLNGPFGTAQFPFFSQYPGYVLEADVDLSQGVVTGALASCNAEVRR